ncbi:hypothetical protein QUF80_09265 [Desulfococcaceae bacterium HSG8]|nr:hypothetical protein [Desulfococcaceae bacterium HSG8]
MNTKKMMIIAICLLSLLISQPAFGDSSKQTFVTGDICYNLIRNLSAYDKQFGNRTDNKRLNAQNADTAHEYVAAMLDIKANGTEYSCGPTRSWVTEIFEGIASQYTEYKNDPDGIDGSGAGYETRIGDALVSYFAERADSEKPIIYHLRHTGSEDHVFAVEQLPNGQGYRIYQSYRDAYSLYAWLSHSTDGLFKADNGDIKVWRILQATVDGFIMQMSGGQASLNNLEALPETLQPLLPYIEYVRDYDENKIMANFKTAWNLYGKGRILSKEEFFDDYLAKTAVLTEYLNEYDTTDSARPQNIWETWIGLYGSPNSLHFPNFPNNFLTSMLYPDRIYRFEIMSVVLPADAFAVRAACVSNARILKNAIESPVAKQGCQQNADYKVGFSEIK